jgi:hypothetical protein
LQRNSIPSFHHRSVAVCCLLAGVAAGCADDDESTAAPSAASARTESLSTPAPTPDVPTTVDATTAAPSTAATPITVDATTAPPMTTEAATTEPSATTSAPPTPRLFDHVGALAAGTYLVDKFDTPLRITVPAGWSTFGDFAVLSPQGFEAGYLGFWDVVDVNVDACNWHGRANVGVSVDALVAGLVGQLGMDVTGPTAIDVDGRTGQALTLSPADVDPATCDEGLVSPWFEADGDSRFYAGPDETETVWIVDLAGRRALINAGSVVNMTPDIRAQLDEMLTSIRVG